MVIIGRGRIEVAYSSPLTGTRLVAMISLKQAPWCSYSSPVHGGRNDVFCQHEPLIWCSSLSLAHGGVLRDGLGREGIALPPASVPVCSVSVGKRVVGSVYCGVALFTLGAQMRVRRKATPHAVPVFFQNVDMGRG